MTDQQHPITPPQDLIERWIRDANHNESMFAQVAIMGARWGADQELEACCEWVEHEIGHGREWGEQLRAARRPKPPSLKEQALTVLDDASDRLDAAHENIIRRALELLPS